MPKPEDIKVTQHLIEDLEKKLETAKTKYHRNETTMKVDNEYIFEIYSPSDIFYLDDEVGSFDEPMIKDHFKSRGIEVEIRKPHHTELEITLRS